MKKLELYKARKIVETTLNNGGYSFKEYHDGYMVSLAGSESKISIKDNSISNIVNRIVEFFDDYGTVNTWLDNETIYLDVSVNIENIQEALTFAKQNKQLAIYDCKNGQAISI